MSFPVKNPVPVLNDSANMALSKWNNVSDKLDKNVLDSFVNAIKINGVGTDLSLNQIAYDSDSDSVIYGKGTPVKIHVSVGGITSADFEELEIDSNVTGGGISWPASDDSMLVPTAVLGFIVNCSLSEESDSFIGTDGTTIPVKNYIQSVNVSKFTEIVGDFLDNGASGKCAVDGVEYQRVIINNDENASPFVFVRTNNGVFSVVIPACFMVLVNGVSYPSKTTCNDDFTTLVLKIPEVKGPAISSKGFSYSNVSNGDNNQSVIISGNSSFDSVVSQNIVNGKSIVYKEIGINGGIVCDQGYTYADAALDEYTDCFSVIDANGNVSRYPAIRVEVSDFSSSLKSVFTANTSDGYFYSDAGKKVGEVILDNKLGQNQVVWKIRMYPMMLGVGDGYFEIIDDYNVKIYAPVSQQTTGENRCSKIRAYQIGGLGDELGIRDTSLPSNDFLQVTTPIEFTNPLINTCFVLNGCKKISVVSALAPSSNRYFIGSTNGIMDVLPPWLFFVQLSSYNPNWPSGNNYVLSVKKEDVCYLEDMKLYGLEEFVYPGGCSGFSKTSYVSGIYEDLIDSSNKYCPFKYNNTRGDLSLDANNGISILFFPVYIRR